MHALLFGLAVFAFTLAVHVPLWRLRVVAPTVRNLVLIHLAVAAGAVAVVLAVPALAAPGAADLVRGLLVGWFSFLAYLSQYMAVELDSASAVMLLHVAAAPPEGVTEADLLGLLDDEDVVLSRLRELVGSGMVGERDGSYRLRWKGRLMIGAVRFVRRWYTPDPVGG
ncbi:MAG: hypothetical protein FJ087_14195 [Deltaproteobacteria bacterium]|nr:hypothetical protein [Deltaproteobacteria bacterium]